MSDLIKREDVIRKIDEWIQRGSNRDDDIVISEFLSFLKGDIDSIPSADRPQGKWINGQTINGVDYKRCNQCFAEIDDSFFGESSFDVNFCPNCGADMRERKESE